MQSLRHSLARSAAPLSNQGVNRISTFDRLITTKAVKSAKRNTGKTQFITLDGEDYWRLDSVVDLIKDGAVGIIPTDSYPALVCDLENKSAVELLYDLKGANKNKPLSILCRNFQDISTYTLGFPVSNIPGSTDFYKIAKRILPGPYTLILKASKELPKQILNSGKSKHRTTVGVRMPDHPICLAILQQLDRPLLCGSAMPSDEGEDLVDAATLADLYSTRGLGFVVDAPDSAPPEPSSVIDLSGSEPVVIREGKGDTSFLD